MKRVFRWLLRITSVAVVLATLLVIAIYFLAARSLPDYDTTLTSAEVTAPVEIVRDTAAVPHIFGATDEDVFFGLGYAHAQDRLWQMVLMRRTAQGRLSEIFGERTLNVDRMMRQFDLYNLSIRATQVQTPEAMAVLKAYSAGVNARLNEINEKALGRGAPELFLFNADIAPWTPADSLAVLKMMAVQLSGHMQSEILRAQTALMISPERLADILPDVPGEGIAALPDYASLFPMGGFDPVQTASNDLYDNPLSPFNAPDFAGASNAFVASPERSAAGGALLANDPHLGFTAPTIWYLARLELSSGGIIGGGIPGLPLILSGRSADLGWGVTSSYMDDQDLFIEEVNPEDPNEYRTEDGFEQFVSRPTIIKVKDAAPETYTLRWTRNGPVLPSDALKINTITPRGHVAALSWTALTPDDTSFSAALAMMKSKTVRQAIAAAKDFIGPSQNLSLADANGAIGMKTIGAMPRRDAAHQ
ncbi:MAG: penicillin acylase family protein, partial [Pseudomonadota bacterium]|nr:penicillin acylase family protein [Pseudomonadota bacterium]